MRKFPTNSGVTVNLESIINLWESADAPTEDMQVGPTPESRYRGVLLGYAVGNLLGIAVKVWIKFFSGRGSLPVLGTSNPKNGTGLGMTTWLRR
jgi:hypothetical protein